MRSRRPRHLRAVTGREITRYRVRLTVPRATGWYEWTLARSDFEERLAEQAGLVVAGPHIDSERRRGRDYVTVTISMTVTAPDVAEALAAGWEVFLLAAADYTAGWDMAGATAEVRPEARLRPPGEYTAAGDERLFKFTVDSTSRIAATVPAGASTGPVTVTGPGGRRPARSRSRSRPASPQ